MEPRANVSKFTESSNSSSKEPPSEDEVCCENCEALRDRLQKLSYCLAVARRLTDLSVA